MSLNISCCARISPQKNSFCTIQYLQKVKEWIVKKCVFASFLVEPQIIDDVIKVAQLLVYLEEQLSEFFSVFFEREMADLQSPDIIMEELLKRIKTEMDCQVSNNKKRNTVFVVVFGAKLQNVDFLKEVS